MRKKYIGITIGPIFDTIQDASSPAAMWFTSFLFSDLTRRIYIKGYRYNLHLAKRAMLVEVGAQNNTVEEAKNAMKPLAEMLYRLLSGEKSYKKN